MATMNDHNLTETNELKDSKDVKGIFTMMLSNGSVLLVQNKKDGLWGPPGGKVTDKQDKTFNEIEQEEWLEETHYHLPRNRFVVSLVGPGVKRYNDGGKILYSVRQSLDKLPVELGPLPLGKEEEHEWNSCTDLALIALNDLDTMYKEGRLRCFFGDFWVQSRSQIKSISCQE